MMSSLCKRKHGIFAKAFRTKTSLQITIKSCSKYEGHYVLKTSPSCKNKMMSDLPYIKDCITFCMKLFRPDILNWAHISHISDKR